MGLNELINKYEKQWNALEKRRFNEWTELKTRHEAEVIGKGEKTPEMQKRFDNEIGRFNDKWKYQQAAFEKRKAAEINSELDKENNIRQFVADTKALNKIINDAKNEHEKATHELNEIEKPIPELKEPENSIPELTETEKKKLEFLEAMRAKTERNKENGLER